MEKSGLKTAVRTATNFLNEVYENEEIFDLLLEEIEDNKKNWFITISFKRKIPKGAEPDPFSALVNPNRFETKYKRLLIEKDSSEVKKMENRDVSNE